jgi:hypothetical protein
VNSTAPGQLPVMDYCELGKESSGFIQVKEFLDRLSDYQVREKDQLPRVVSLQSLSPSKR